LAVFFLTHWADFNSWEVAQKLRTALKQGWVNSSSLAIVGIGSSEAGRQFVEMLALPQDVLVFADDQAGCHEALRFSRGALPEYSETLNPYFRVFLMLLGIGSPGTIRTVLGGYFGDRSMEPEKTIWIDDALRQNAKAGRWPAKVPRLSDGQMVDFAEIGRGVWDDTFGTGGLRPMELATVRLQNMVGGILANWSKLAPADDELLVQQGGAVVLDSDSQAVYYYRDKGILTYAPVDETLTALKPGKVA